MTKTIFSFPGGKLKDNVVVKGTAAAAGKGDFSEDETTHHFVVPAGKRWLLFGGGAKPDVNATVYSTLYNEDDVILGTLHSVAAGVAMTNFPESPGTEGMLGAPLFPFPMKAGWYIKVVFGAQQAATAYVLAVVLEIDVE